MGKLDSDSSWLTRSTSKSSSKTKKKKKSPSTSTSTSTIVGVFALEVANIMSKTANLWHSLTHTEISKLRDEVFQLRGVRKLVSDDDRFLLSLVLSEIIDSLRSISQAVTRLGDKCSDPVLQRFDRVFTSLMEDELDAYGLEYAWKKMGRKVKKMERLVCATWKLYEEVEVLAEMEQTLRRMQVQQAAARGRLSCSLDDCKQKVAWQRQEVKCLRDGSVWNRSFDYTVRLLARSLFTIVGRIRHVFGFRRSVEIDDAQVEEEEKEKDSKNQLSYSVSQRRTGSVQQQQPWKEKKHRWMGADSPALPRCMPHFDAGFQMASSVPRRRRRRFGMEDADYFRRGGKVVSSDTSLYRLFCESPHKSLILKPPASTLGGSALALHYANVIIAIEKLAGSRRHLIDEDARDDLYYMLPTSIRAALRARLKPYSKKNDYGSALAFSDPILAAEWSDAMSRMLNWLAPLAHNMIRWQSERNFEQQNMVSSTIFLLPTLYFANQAKTEAAVTELLVGLNYLWRFRREFRCEICTGVCKHKEV